MADKPLAASLGWSVRPSYLFKGPHLNVRHDAIRRSGGRDETYTYVEHPGSVFVVPITPDNRVLLLRTYRYTVDAWSWEVPAGGLAEGESPESAALRELEEEIGGVPERLEQVGAFFMGNGYAHLRAHFFVASDLRQALEPRPDALEQIQRVEAFTAAEVDRLVRNGALTDGDSMLALSLALRHAGSTGVGSILPVQSASAAERHE